MGSQIPGHLAVQGSNNTKNQNRGRREWLTQKKGWVNETPLTLAGVHMYRWTHSHNNTYRHAHTHNTSPITYCIFIHGCFLIWYPKSSVLNPMASCCMCCLIANIDSARSLYAVAQMCGKESASVCAHQMSCLSLWHWLSMKTVLTPLYRQDFCWVSKFAQNTLRSWWYVMK